MWEVCVELGGGAGVIVKGGLGLRFLFYFYFYFVGLFVFVEFMGFWVIVAAFVVLLMGKVFIFLYV
ncbi:MAG: hypothetical protein DRJ52_08985 [Thermoprotei archaeon]|nr:MAG: hypothetical protein DRJ52_08985 [Thermoprotei archaeon]